MAPKPQPPPPSTPHTPISTPKKKKTKRPITQASTEASQKLDASPDPESHTLTCTLLESDTEFLPSKYSWEKDTGKLLQYGSETGNKIIPKAHRSDWIGRYADGSSYEQARVRMGWREWEHGVDNQQLRMALRAMGVEMPQAGVEVDEKNKKVYRDAKKELGELVRWRREAKRLAQLEKEIEDEDVRIRGVAALKVCTACDECKVYKNP